MYASCRRCLGRIVSLRQQGQSGGCLGVERICCVTIEMIDDIVSYVRKEIIFPRIIGNKPGAIVHESASPNNNQSNDLYSISR